MIILNASVATTAVATLLTVIIILSCIWLLWFFFAYYLWQCKNLHSKQTVGFDLAVMNNGCMTLLSAKQHSWIIFNSKRISNLIPYFVSETLKEEAEGEAEGGIQVFSSENNIVCCNVMQHSVRLAQL